MLRSIRQHLCGLKVQAKDGILADVDDVYFDEFDWRVRYLVTSTWLNGRRVILATPGLEPGRWTGSVIPTNLTKHQVRTAPDIGPDPPTRTQEKELAQHYSWPDYWDQYGEVIPHGMPIPADRIVEHSRGAARESDTRLKSLDITFGYPVQAKDGEAGKIEDYLVDDTDWTVRYAIVHTATLRGRRVLVPRESFLPVDWDGEAFRADQPCETIKNAPVYRPGHLDRDFEAQVYAHYGRPVYWKAA